MSSIVKALNGIDFYYRLNSGAIQKVCGNTDSGIWNVGSVKFAVCLSFPDEEGVWKDVTADIAQIVNWRLIQEKITNGDYANLPARKEFLDQSPQDFLTSIGVITIEIVPNQWINGQPAQQIIVTPEYRI